ncbi:MAG: sensor histidine kinase [Pseudonocardiaceae bacterium]
MGQQRCDCPEAVRLRALFHDLGNHLVTFSCLLEAVDGESGMSPAAQCHVPLMRTQTTRMLDLLREAVDQDRQPERIAVRELIGEIVAMAGARGQATVRLNDGDERWLCTHPAALWRVVANVVDNAIRAAGCGGRVEISVHDQRPHVVIEVVDDGPGFGNAPAGTASLGLGIAVSLAEQCEGTVQVLPAYPHGVRIRLEFRDLVAKHVAADQRGHP